MKKAGVSGLSLRREGELRGDFHDETNRTGGIVTAGGLGGARDFVLDLGRAGAIEWLAVDRQWM